MSQSVAASRYAIALFNLAKESNQISEIQQELLELKEAYENNAELEQLLENPKLPIEKKKELLKGVFQGANPYILNTLFVLLEKKRLNETVNLINEFNELANDAAGVAEATVYSTRPLTADESEAISTTFGQKIGKQSLSITNSIDPSLIGGIRLQIGNRIYDSSLSAKLERLKKELIGS